MSDKKRVSDSDGIGWGGVLVFGALGWGAWLWLLEWWAVNGETVLRRARLVGMAVLGGVLLVLVARWWWRRRSARAARGPVGDGWASGDRDEFAVVAAAGAGRKPPGMGQRPGKASPALELWPMVLRQSSGLGSPQGVARVMWTRDGGKLVWGVSVDRQIGPSVRRAVGSVWPDTGIEPWPHSVAVSDSVPTNEGGGTVVRRYLVPAVMARPLFVPSGTPDHPMARVADVLDAHPDVDVQLRVDLVPLSPAARGQVCEQRLETLDVYDPDRNVWETADKQQMVAGVRVLLRVARAGAGHASECMRVADQVCGVLNSAWATDFNRLTVREVSDELFDQIWETGVVERDVPAWHWDCLHTLLGPAPPKVGKTVSRRLPDPPGLETFDPYYPAGLMPIGVLAGGRMVGVPWGGPTDPGVDLTVGGTGSGKTYHAMARVIALAEQGRGVLVLDTHRTATRALKEHFAGHADRILEIDLRAVNDLGEPVSAGWNPLDLTVVPAHLRKGRIDTLKGMLPVALFPTYFGANSKSPQTSAIIRKALECLLCLNLRLPAELQTNIFCIENLLLDETWREQAISQLPVRDQKWWTRTYPMIVGQKGASSAALKPALNALEQWKSQDRIQALLGASTSTVRWREIIDEGKILFLALNNDGSETDKLLARLMVGEMVAAFKERGLSPNGKVRPFHLFLDEFQSYAPVLEAQAEVIVQELRKFGAKVHFLCQSPSVLSKRMREVIFANCTHLFCGRLPNPADAEQMAKQMGGDQVSHRRETTGSETVQSRDLRGLRHWQFICQVTQNGNLSEAFQLKGIDTKKAWEHLRTGRDITPQIAANTGLEPVEARLDHYDTLPDHVSRWLTQNTNALTPV